MVLSSFSSMYAKDNEKVDKNEIKQMNEQMFELLLNKQGDDIAYLKLYQKYKEIFEETPQLYIDYCLKSDAYGYQLTHTEEKVIEKKNEVETGVEYILFKDGSFLFASSETEQLSVDAPVINDQLSIRGTLYSFSEYGEKTYGSYRTTTTYTISYALYPDLPLKLNTEYTVSEGGVTMTSATTTGTNSYFPVVVSSSASVELATSAHEGQFAKSKGLYNVSYIFKDSPVFNKSYEINLIIETVLPSFGSNSAYLYAKVQVFD